MDPMLVLIGGPIVLLALFALALAWHPRRGREVVGELRRWKDYGAMAEVEAHDTDEMLDGIEEHRRHTGRREVGEELADDLMRGTWEKD
jgi:hypothetical protein